MDFKYSEEQLALQDTLRRFIAKNYSFEQRRAQAKSQPGMSREHWAQFADFGLLALPFSEDCGGLGGNAVDTLLVMEQFGRGLVLEPYLPAVVLCGSLIRDFASAAQKQALLPAIAAGELILALAHYEPGGRYELNRVATRAVADADGYTLSGDKAVVLAAPWAEQFIVSARTAGETVADQGISLFLVDRAAPGLSLNAYPTQDGSRAAELKLDQVRVSADALLGSRDAALPALARAIDYAIAALCAEAVGAMAAINEATLDYLKTRKQFGQPIGRFQALQHRMVDMVVATEQARSMATLAAVHADSDDATLRRRSVSAAKAYIGQQARAVGQQAVQLHGGMGVVDELNVAHLFKRLTMIGLSFGDSDYHLGLFSEMMDLGK